MQNATQQQETSTLTIGGALITVPTNDLFIAWLQKQMETNIGTKLLMPLVENLRDGELYAGIILGKNAPNQHVILLAGDEKVPSWDRGIEFAADCGGDLPTRREQSLLFANLKDHFQSAWYWSSEQHAAYPDCAWTQNLGSGYQDHYHKTFEGRARAVRRLIIS
jgi:hypothetical protein